MAGDTIRETEGRFNPAVPEVNPDTKAERMLSFSKGIQQPQAPKGTEFALEGLGQTIDVAAKGANYAINRTIEDTARPRIDALREQFSAKLDAVTDAASAGTALQPGSRPSLFSPTPIANQKQVTDALQNVDRKAQIFDIARANNKLTETDYFGRMDQLRKEFINNFPGYEDKVSDTFEKFAGFNSANKYIQSKMADYNALVQANKDEGKQIKNHIISQSHNDPLAAQQAIKYGDATGDWLGAMQHAFKTQGEHYANAQKIQQLQLYEAGSKAQQDQAYRLGVSDLKAEAFKRMNGLLMTVATGEKVPVQDLISSWQDGSRHFDPRDAETLAGMMQAHERSLVNWAEQKFNKEVFPGSGVTMFGILGDKQTAIYNEGLGLWRQTISDLRSKDAGLLFRAHRVMEADIDGTAQRIYGEAPPYLVMAGMNKLLGPQVAALEHSYVRSASGDYISRQKTEALVRGLASGFRGLSKNPDGSWSFSEALGIADREGLDGSNKRKILDFSNIMEDPTMPDSEKIVAAKNMWTPYNAGMISRLTTDDEKKEYFNKWTSDGKADEAFRLGQKDKQVWDYYKNWAGKESYQIYQKNIINLNRSIFGQQDNGYKIAFDSEKSRYDIKELPNFGLNMNLPGSAENYMIRNERFTFAQQQMEKVNDMLRAQAKIAKLEGKDINASLHRFLSAPGIQGDATTALLKGMTGTAFPLQPEDRPPQGGK